MSLTREHQSWWVWILALDGSRISQLTHWLGLLQGRVPSHLITTRLEAAPVAAVSPSASLAGSGSSHPPPLLLPPLYQKHNIISSCRVVFFMGGAHDIVGWGQGGWSCGRVAWFTGAVTQMFLLCSTEEERWCMSNSLNSLELFYLLQVKMLITHTHIYTVSTQVQLHTLALSTVTPTEVT